MNPTTTRAGAVAKDGIAKKIGDKNRDKTKHDCCYNAVRPVRPPSATSRSHFSTKVVVVDSTKYRTNRSCNRIGSSAPRIVRKLAIFVQHICLGSNTDQSS